MIQVTLQFTSLAAAVKALKDIPETAIASPLAPVAATSTPLPPVDAPAPKPEKAAKTDKVAAGPTVAPAPAAATAPAAAPTPAPAPAAQTQASGEAIEYPVLQKAVFALAAKSRPAAGEVAASFGVKTFKELDPARWPEALAAVNAKLAELEG